MNWTPPTPDAPDQPVSAADPHSGLPPRPPSAADGYQQPPPVPPQWRPPDRPRLMRNSTGPLGGVATGIADWLGIDPIIVQLGFIAAAFLGGAGVLVYLILWLVLPELTPSGHVVPASSSGIAVAAVVGILAIVGPLSLLSFRSLLGPSGSTVAALVLVGVGVYVLTRATAGTPAGTLPPTPPPPPAQNQAQNQARYPAQSTPSSPAEPGGADPGGTATDPQPDATVASATTIAHDKSAPRTGGGDSNHDPMPDYSQPGYSQPGYSQPDYVKPGPTPSGYGQPGYGQPGYGQPGYGQPVYASSGYAPAGYAQPGYDATGYWQPGVAPSGTQATPAAQYYAGNPYAWATPQAASDVVPTQRPRREPIVPVTLAIAVIAVGVLLVIDGATGASVGAMAIWGTFMMVCGAGLVASGLRGWIAWWLLGVSTLAVLVLPVIAAASVGLTVADEGVLTVSVDGEALSTVGESEVFVNDEFDLADEYEISTGELLLDLTDLTLTDDRTTTVDVQFGSAVIILPSGSNIDVVANVKFGNLELDHEWAAGILNGETLEIREGEPDDPVLTITATVTFGDLVVERCTACN